MISQKDWKWFGTAGHFICAHHCRYHLCTQVGKYLVSTVGQYWPERGSREIHAKVHDPGWLQVNQHLLGDYFDHAYMKRFGYEDIGYNRKFESMVFKAGKTCNAKGCDCGQPEISGSELDFEAYKTVGEANKGHLELCEKYARIGGALEQRGEGKP